MLVSAFLISGVACVVSGVTFGVLGCLSITYLDNPKLHVAAKVSLAGWVGFASLFLAIAFALNSHR